MLSYKFIIREDRDDMLVLRLTNNRKKVEVSMGVQMSVEDLSDALSDHPKPKNIKWSALLAKYKAKIDEVKCELLQSGRSDEDVRVIKDMVVSRTIAAGAKEDVGGEFVTWFQRFADTHAAGTRTRSGYGHTLSRIRDYDKDIDKMSFADITVAWLDGLDLYWSRSMSVNSRNHHMRNIRAVIKYAIRNDLDIRNPFDRMRLKKEETQKRSLSVDDLRDIFTLPVEPYAEVYRDMFVLTFMLIGINPIDLYRLEGIKDGRINYRRAKTHKLYSIRIEPEAAKIIKKYRGERYLLMLADRWEAYESFARGCNTALQAMGAPRPAPGVKRKKNGKYPDLTLYWARHTWATIASDLDIPDATIALALGHSGGYEGANATTGIYIKRNNKKIDDANRKVLDWVLYGKK